MISGVECIDYLIQWYLGGYQIQCFNVVGNFISMMYMKLELINEYSLGNVMCEGFFFICMLLCQVFFEEGMVGMIRIIKYWFSNVVVLL